MGREIRRVPRGWKHPRNERGDYRPLYDRDYETAAQEWLDAVIAWANGTHEDITKYPGCKENNRYYWEWADGPPDEAYYRQKWTEEPTCYQIYQTVSEGTPVSPVFETLDDMGIWLKEQGYSDEATQAFLESGWAPSMVVSGGKITMSIESLAI